MGCLFRQNEKTSSALFNQAARKAGLIRRADHSNRHRLHARGKIARISEPTSWLASAGDQNGGAAPTTKINRSQEVARLLATIRVIHCKSRNRKVGDLFDVSFSQRLAGDESSFSVRRP